MQEKCGLRKHPVLFLFTVTYWRLRLPSRAIVDEVDGLTLRILHGTGFGYDVVTLSQHYATSNFEDGLYGICRRDDGGFGYMSRYHIHGLEPIYEEDLYSCSHMFIENKT